MSKSQNRVTLGLAVSLVAATAALMFQSVSYENLELKVAEANAKTFVAEQVSKALATELNAANTELNAANTELVDKTTLINLSAPVIKMAHATVKDCLEVIHGGYCTITLYNVSGRGIVSGSQL